MLLPTLYWIADASPGRLAIVSRPRGDEDLPEDIAGLARLGIRRVVSLLEASEARELGLRAEHASCASHGIEFVRLPIPDRGTPEDARAFVASARSLYQQLQAGVVIAVHCRAGIGRSGLLVASLLVISGRSAGEAFAITSKARGVKVPDTSAQEAWLQTHARALQTAA